MSLRRGDMRRGKVGAVLTTVGALVAFQALAIVGATGASAVTACTYNPATDTINITIDPTDAATVTVETADDDLDPAAAPGAILFDDGGGFAACGSATNSNTVSIVVLGSPGSAETFQIDEDAGGTFNTAIAWAVDLGTGSVDQQGFFLNCDQDNNLVLTNTTFNLNGAVGEVLGAEDYDVEGCDGDDVIDASAVTFEVNRLHGHGGDDVLSPGTADDGNVEGDVGDDTLSYATRTTCTFVANGSSAGLDANCDGDNGDVGDEDDTLLDCFEVVVTGSGNDTLNDSGCGDSVYAPGAGVDDIINDDFGDTLDLSSSSAGVVIDHPNQTATGQGTDTWEGLANWIGSAFDDTLLIDEDGAPGPDVNTFSGLGGVDTVDGSAATAGVFIDLDGLDPDVDDLENAIGSAFNDTLFGNDLDNVLTGNDGNDDLEGSDGRDTLDGGPGNDDLEGDDGNDLLIGGPGDDFFAGNAGADTVSFATNTTAGVVVDLSLFFATSPDSGDDDFGTALEEIIVGSPFADQITGGPLGDGGTLNFLFKGGGGNDILTGFNGNDTLKGGGGKDTLRGVAGDDTMAGAKGNDLLSGGKGFDIGKGGKGKDVCKGVEQKRSCGTPNNPTAPQTALGRRD